MSIIGLLSCLVIIAYNSDLQMQDKITFNWFFEKRSDRPELFGYLCNYNPKSIKIDYPFECHCHVTFKNGCMDLLVYV